MTYTRPNIRVGDLERSTAAERLVGALVDGRLDLDEFDTRVSRAYAATTGADLEALFADLPAPVPAGPALVRVGTISVTATSVITPAGEFPLRGSTWLVTDRWESHQARPAWSIAAALVGLLVLPLVSLLFLLVKETRYTGTVQIFASGKLHTYSTRVPVTTRAEIETVHRQVAYVRSRAA